LPPKVAKCVRPGAFVNRGARPEFLSIVKQIKIFRNIFLLDDASKEDVEGMLKDKNKEVREATEKTIKYIRFFGQK
jgi:hypothetical protein